MEPPICDWDTPGSNIYGKEVLYWLTQNNTIVVMTSQTEITIIKNLYSNKILWCSKLPTWNSWIWSCLTMASMIPVFIRNPSTKKKYIEKRKTKRWGHPLRWPVIGNDNSTSVYNYSKYLTSSLDWNSQFGVESLASQHEESPEIAEAMATVAATRKWHTSLAIAGTAKIGVVWCPNGHINVSMVD